MLKLLKKAFPGLYDWYKHIQRLHEIRTAEARKKLTKEKQLKEIESAYLRRIGHPLDWNNLKSYTEKMQWEKLYNSDSRKSILADKVAVRDWVAETIGEEYLIPVLGVWKKFDDIDFDQLPNRFVLKTNHGSGTNYIVRNKAQMNVNKARMLFNDWLRMDYGYADGYELHYSHIRPLIYAEEYIDSGLTDLQDYKFLCFSGKPCYCWVDMGRYTHHTRNVYDLQWNLQPWNQDKFGIYKDPISKPQNFDTMIELAQKLCEGFPQVRIDLYNIDGKIYFGEMTFTNGKGYDPIIPEEYDLKLGELWDITCEISN